MHARRLVRDYERLRQHTEAMFTIAAITLMSHRLTRQPARTDAATQRTAPALQELESALAVPIRARNDASVPQLRGVPWVLCACARHVGCGGLC